MLHDVQGLWKFVCLDKNDIVSLTVRDVPREGSVTAENSLVDADEAGKLQMHLIIVGVGTGESVFLFFTLAYFHDQRYDWGSLD